MWSRAARLEPFGEAGVKTQRGRRRLRPHQYWKPTRGFEPRTPSLRENPGEGDAGPSEGGEGRKRPARCPHCGGLLEPEEDPRELGDVRGEYAGDELDEGGTA
jgi:hypothetical protein